MTRNRVIGIGYDPEGLAPTIVMKGSGEQVDPILAAATAADIPVVRDATLADQLYRVPIDAPIGRELFPVMAVLLAQVLDLDHVTHSGESSR
jgi:type III secretion system FlhB-like substrate exporter